MSVLGRLARSGGLAGGLRSCRSRGWTGASGIGHWRRGLATGGGPEVGGGGGLEGAGGFDGAVDESAAGGERIVEMAKGLADMTTFGAGDDGFRWWHPMRSLLRFVHESLDAPWWFAISLTTILLRTLIVPATFKSFKFQEKLRMLQPEIQKINADAKALALKGNSEAAMKEQEKARKLMASAGSLWQQLLVPILQMPIFLSMFRALNKMADGESGFSDGGLWWMMDLSLKDSTHIAPVLTSISTLVMMETARPESNPGKEASGSQVALKMVGRAFAVGSIVITWNMPCGVFFYWIPNAVFGVVINAVMRRPAINEWIMRGRTRNPKDVIKGDTKPETKAAAPHPEVMSDLDAALSYMHSRNLAKDGGMGEIHLKKYHHSKWGKKRRRL